VTIFSDAVPIPWERVTPHPGTSNYPPQAMQSAVRATNDIALIGYGERLLVSGSPYAYETAEYWLRAVRYTEDGPELGPAVRFPPPVLGIYALLNLLVDDDGVIWIVAGMGIYNSSSSSAVGSYLHIGRVTINATTLAVAVQWQHQVPVGNNDHSETHVDIWPAQRILVVTLGNATASYLTARATWLIHLDTGAIVATRALPLTSGTTNSVWVRAMAFHPGRQELLIIGDRTTGGYDRPTFWTAPITATSIGAFVRFVPPGLPVGYRDDITSEGWEAIALPTKWMAAGIWSRDDEYNSSNGWWGSTRLRNYSFDGATITEQSTPLSEVAMGGYSSGRSLKNDLGVTDTGAIVAAVVEPTDRTTSSAGTGIGGVRHVEIGVDGATVLGSQILPKTSNIIERDASVCAVALGGGRFIYLVSGPGITGLVTTRLASLAFAVYAGGPIMKPPFVPGIKGEAPEENRRAFRRVN